MPGRAVAAGRVEPDQGQGPGDHQDREEDPGPGPLAGRPGEDEAEQGQRQEGDRHRVADRHRHRPGRQDVGLRGGLVGVERALSLDGQRRPTSAPCPGLAPTAGLVESPPLVATIGAIRQAGPITRNADGRPPAGPEHPGRPQQRDHAEGRHQRRRQQQPLGSDPVRQRGEADRRREPEERPFLEEPERGPDAPGEEEEEQALAQGVGHDVPGQRDQEREDHRQPGRRAAEHLEGDQVERDDQQDPRDDRGHLRGDLPVDRGRRRR